MKNKIKKLSDERIKISKSDVKICSANKQTIVFSFEYFTEVNEFNFHYFDKQGTEGFRVYNSFIDKLTTISQKTWEDMNNTCKRNGGTEKMTIGEFRDKFANALKHVTKEESVYVVRFYHDNFRLFFRRGKKCGRVAQLLACEFEIGTAYKH